MFPSMSSCARTKTKIQSVEKRPPSAISDFSCYRIASETNETCLLSSPQCLVEFWSNDGIWHFGSRLLCLFDSMSTCSCASTEKKSNLAVWFPARTKWNFSLTGWLSHLLQDHWSDCLKVLVRMFPSMSSCVGTKTKIQSLEKHGRRRPFLIFLVIASPQNRMKLAYKARLNV